jgi:acyl dehydratase
MVDKSIVGLQSDPEIWDVEKGAVRRFAEAIGDANPLYTDEGAAKAAGYRSLLAPPTFPIVLTMNERFRQSLDLASRSLLHGEQSFEYFKPIVAGDRLTVVTRVADVAERAGASGPMSLVVLEDEGKDERGELVFRSKKTLVLRRS